LSDLSSNFRLHKLCIRANPLRFLVGKFAARSVTRDGSDWIVRAEVESASARDVNPAAAQKRR
jgi:hypothetical protein